MNDRSMLVVLLPACLIVACGQPVAQDTAPTPAGGAGGHTHADGTTHGDHGHTHDDGTTHSHGDDDGHGHGEVGLGTVVIGGMTVTLAQGHGAIQAGKESHLVVKLPYTDKGSSVVRAWIGTPDRTLSYVGKGAYSASKDAYDIHATAPAPLPDDAAWWIEIEKPDGTTVVGSARAIKG